MKKPVYGLGFLTQAHFNKKTAGASNRKAGGTAAAGVRFNGRYCIMMPSLFSYLCIQSSI